MNPFSLPLSELESFRQLCDGLDTRKDPLCKLATGVIDSQKNHLAFALLEKLNRPGLYITDSELRAKEVYEDLRFFLGDKVKFYPSRDLIFYTADTRSIDINRQRFKILKSIFDKEDVTIVLSVDALFDRFIPMERFEKFIFKLSEAEEIDLSLLVEKLIFMGYERRNVVEGNGQFSVRGGILDLFPINMENAVRLEFWGDEIDSIRLLDSMSQRSIERIGEVLIYPIRELVYENEELQRAISLMDAEYQKHLNSLNKKGLNEEAATLKEQMGEVIRKLSENHSFNGVDVFLQYFYKEELCLLDYLPKNTLVFVDEPSRVSSHSESLLFEFEESIKSRILKGYFLPSQAGMIIDYSGVCKRLRQFHTILFSTLTHSIKDFTLHDICHFDVKSVSGLKTVSEKLGIDPLVNDLKYWCKNNYRTVFLVNSRAQAESVLQELKDYELPAVYAEGEDFKKGIITLTRGSLRHGFEYRHINFALISSGELFERPKKRHKVRKKGELIQSFTDLKIGDYVVHEAHGIGIYRGIEQIYSDNTCKDYLKLEYADNGVLFVNTNQLELLQKYIGGEGQAKLNKLGGTRWATTKQKAKKAVDDIAKELIALYAKRNMQSGVLFDKYSEWEKEFDETFPYEETDDQLQAIQDVRRDMETGKVMDRLVCGDVGYGKTEIAIRAAFKTILGGYQVAYLVPTTILAQQVFNNFCQRMQGFGVSLACLSRFRSKREQNDTVERLRKGKVDVVVGTHRLLSKDIDFKKLGLIIIDEEQRFGVVHKEKLKTMKENVNVLTLTATPIPRTLHMSLTGIRDMSILEEPPQERLPVQTYVCEYNLEFVKDAIKRELAREGQVYYLHNRVQNITEVTSRLKSLVPEANIAYAHGQMSEQELEGIMMDFIEGEIDVLVCTTIVENGLDISNVNTIIINDADHLGLAQLYQLRGRVGRSNRLAYAYLMYKKDKVLSDISEKRLSTIREFTEFGSGFKIAMRDLELRGSGNLLGAEQHGNIDAVGYELYCKLLNDSILEQTGRLVRPNFETAIELKLNAYIPSKYIEDEMQKLEIYKKISLISDEGDYNDVWEEIEDRFGNVPDSVKTLLDVALLKAEAHGLGITALTQKGESIVISFGEHAQLLPDRITELIKVSKGKILFSNIPSPYLTLKGFEASPKALREFLGKLR